ncbi:MAG: hypothetical protein JKY32_01510 [Rhizobiales bacterium]|nr:hypothetical protein [Hyphomicrobiales bacterium]
MHTTHIMRNAFSAMAIAFLAIVSTQAPAIANSKGEAIADHFIGLLSEYGASDVGYDGAEYDSSTDVTTIYDFRLVNPKEETEMTIKTLELRSVDLHASGSLSAESMVANILHLVEIDDDTQISIARMTILDPLFPLKEEIEDDNKNFVYRLASEVLIEDMVVEAEITVPVARIHISRGQLDGDIPNTMSFVIDNLVVQTKDIEDPDTREQLDKYGYREVDFSFSSNWTWDSGAEIATVGPLRFTVADMATVTFEMTAGNVTRELLMSLENEDKLMELAQLLTLVSAHYWVEDDTITDRVISIISDESDLSPSTMIGIWVDLSRRQLMDQGMPEDFIKMVVKATEYFLNNPGRMDISANPETPIPATQLMGSIMFGPAALVPLLNISVTAE